MNNEVATTPTTQTAAVIPAPKLSVLASLGTRYNVEPAKLLETLKNTVFKNSTEAQLMALCIVADQYQLNPFTKQIYAFPDKGGGIVPVIGVDGWMKMMNEHPQFDGVEIEVAEDQTTGKPYSVTATIHVKNRKFPTKVTEHLSECARNTDPWNKQPRRMLRHRAIIQAIRVAFGFSAMDPEEADALQLAAPANSGKPDFGPAIVTSEPAPIQAPPAEAPRRGRPPKSLPAVTNIEATVQKAPEPEAPSPLRGRPPGVYITRQPKQVIDPSVGGPGYAPAAPPPAEPPAAPAPAPTPAAKSTINFVRGIRGMLTLSQISEDELLEYGRAELGWEDSLTELEQVQEIQPSKLEGAYNEWDAISKAIKLGRQAA